FDCDWSSDVCSSDLRNGNSEAGLEFRLAKQLFAGLDGQIRVTRHPHAMMTKQFALVIACNKLLKGHLGGNCRQFHWIGNDIQLYFLGDGRATRKLRSIELIVVRSAGFTVEDSGRQSSTVQKAR